MGRTGKEGREPGVPFHDLMKWNGWAYRKEGRGTVHIHGTGTRSFVSICTNVTVLHCIENFKFKKYYELFVYLFTFEVCVM